ncbi:MAG: hypothetical protein LBH91_02555 [Prevotellaceae bacterium]|nr:hypothetical protein [Prevotellaceae bacterium]
MKTKLSTLLLFAIIVTSCGGGGTQPKASENAKKTAKEITAMEKKLPFERGSYVEVTSTMGIELKKIIYFDNWGEWTATEEKTEMTMMGYTHISHNLEIAKGKKHWKIDMVEKTGTYYELKYEAAGGMAAALSAAMGTKTADGTEIKDLGEEEHLSYICKKTLVKYIQMDMEITTLTYGNLTMKMDGKMGSMDVSSQVISIDLSAPPASIFEVPEGIEIEEQNF